MRHSDTDLHAVLDGAAGHFDVEAPVEVGQLGDCSGNTGGVDRLVHLARVLGVELGETVGGGRGGEGGGTEREKRERTEMEASAAR